MNSSDKNECLFFTSNKSFNSMIHHRPRFSTHSVYISFIFGFPLLLFCTPPYIFSLKQDWQCHCCRSPSEQCDSLSLLNFFIFHWKYCTYFFLSHFLVWPLRARCSHFCLLLTVGNESSRELSDFSRCRPNNFLFACVIDTL